MRTEKEILQDFRKGPRFNNLTVNEAQLEAIIDNQKLILEALLNVRELLFHK